MHGDPYICRFITLLSLFSFTKIILVTADNLLILLLGWEGVGIISYLLVNFWYTGINNNKASLSALFLNKIGDYGLKIFIIASFSIFSDLNLSLIFSLIPYLNSELLFLFSLGILLAAMAKSAILPLHTWLPKAKAGPTPVSA
jgi:NADH-ubiquinone oxidoreductase chain 5